MRNPANGTFFTYPEVYKMLARIASIIIVGALIWLSTKLLPMIFWPNQLKESIVLIFGILLFYFAMFSLVIVILLNSTQDFVLSEHGLRLEVFGYWWRELAWDDVLELKERWMFPGVGILILKHLTPFHRVLGIVYGFTWKPAFFIHISLGVDEYKKALDMIRKYAINLR